MTIATGGKDVTFPPSVILCLALLGRHFLFLLACFEAFVGEVHLDGSTIKRFVEDSRNVTMAMYTPSPPQFLVNQYFLRLLAELCLERWCETPEIRVVVWRRSWQGQCLE